MKLTLSKPITALVQTFLDTLDMDKIWNNTYSTATLRSIIDKGITACGCKMYAKMPVAWLDNDVNLELSDRLNPDETVKTYREYYIILAENETSCLVRLCPKDEDGNIPKGRNCSEGDMAVLFDVIDGSEKFYNYDDAIIEKGVILDL